MKAKNIRNLIHPGRALRKGEECTWATALTVRAALQHVVEDLEAWAAARGGP